VPSRLGLGFCGLHLSEGLQIPAPRVEFRDGHPQHSEVRAKPPADPASSERLFHPAVGLLTRTAALSAASEVLATVMVIDRRLDDVAREFRRWRRRRRRARRWPGLPGIGAVMPSSFRPPALSSCRRPAARCCHPVPAQAVSTHNTARRPKGQHLLETRS